VPYILPSPCAPRSLSHTWYPVNNPLLDLWLAHSRGDETRPHRPEPPPHLMDQTWRFLCACGTTFQHEADAVWRDEAWRSPLRPCVECRAWVDGHRVDRE
jgi:hypothetical protein